MSKVLELFTPPVRAWFRVLAQQIVAMVAVEDWAVDDLFALARRAYAYRALSHGAFSVYLPDGKTKLGELDEEFIFETRPGDTFLLGSQVWRVQSMDDQRIIVGDAAGATPRMPFWRDDYPWRPYELGARIGRFRAALAERVQMLDRSDLSQGHDASAVEAWLQREYALDEKRSSSPNMRQPAIRPAAPKNWLWCSRNLAT